MRLSAMVCRRCYHDRQRCATARLPVRRRAADPQPGKRGPARLATRSAVAGGWRAWSSGPSPG